MQRLFFCGITESGDRCGHFNRDSKHFRSDPQGVRSLENHPVRFPFLGTPSDDSDVDLLVIADFEGKPWRFAVELRDRIKPTIPLDLMVRTPEQLQERLAKHDMLLTEIVGRGTVLYEA